jgi:hypothetical protein
MSLERLAVRMLAAAVRSTEIRAHVAILGMSACTQQLIMHSPMLTVSARGKST